MNVFGKMKNEKEDISMAFTDGEHQGNNIVGGKGFAKGRGKEWMMALKKKFIFRMVIEVFLFTAIITK